MNYVAKLFSTGAVRETPAKVIQLLLREAGTQKIDTIVEIGAGKGELTNALLTNSLTISKYYAFEIDDKACLNLKAAFREVIVKQANAFDFTAHIPAEEKIDLFISSIPLSFYSQKKINELLHSVRSSMSDDGKVIIVFTAFWLIPVFKKKLTGGKLFSFLTLPPYFLFVYTRTNK